MKRVSFRKNRIFSLQLRDGRYVLMQMFGHMHVASFNDGIDRVTYTPFELIDCRDDFNEVRLSFSDWDLLHSLAGDDNIDGYELNGYGVQGLAMASRLNAGWPIESDDIFYNSEGDNCYIHFSSMSEAIKTAALTRKIFSDRESLCEMVGVARAQGFGD
jgi:hypothetical protein